jgi:hypothetical protein
LAQAVLQVVTETAELHQSLALLLLLVVVQAAGKITALFQTGRVAVLAAARLETQLELLPLGLGILRPQVRRKATMVVLDITRLLLVIQITPQVAVAVAVVQ